MASDLQLALDFVVNDLGSQKFTEIANRAQAAGVDIRKSFDEATKASERHERALGKAAQGVEHLGSTFTEQLGPAGGIVEDLVRNVGSLTGGLEDLIAKTGLSSGALLGLAGGAIVVGGLATALEKAAEQAERVEQAVIKAAAGTKNFESSRRAISERAARDSQVTGIPQEQIAAAAGAALGAFGNQPNALAFLRGPENLAVAQLGQLDDLVSRSIPLFKAYGIAVSDSERIFAELAITARETDEPIAQLIQTMAEGAPIAKRLGLSFEDSLSLLGAAGKGGAEPDEVRQALQRLLLVISDSGNAAHKRLQALGVNFQQDLGGIIESINSTIDANGGGKLFEELFPAGRGQSAISSLLKSSRADITNLKLDFVGALKDIRDLAAQVGNEPGSQLSLTGERLRNSIIAAGQAAQDVKAKIFGSKFELPVDISLPDSIAELVTKIRSEVSAGNLEAARADSAELHDLGAKAGQAYSEAFAAARDQQLQKDLGPYAKASALPDAPDWLKRLRQGSLDKFKPGLDEKGFIDQTQRAIELVDDLVSRAAVTVPVTVQAPKDLPAQVDLLQSDIERAVRSLGLTPIEFQPKVLPPDVEQAQKVLGDINAKLANPDGSKKSTESLLDFDKQRARDAVQTILTYYQQVVTAQRISLGIDAQTGGALDKQVAQHQAVLQSIRDALIQLRLQPDQIDKVAAKLPGLAADFERIEQSTTRQAALGFQASSLAAREKALTTARDLARVQGDVAAADDLDRQIIETKAREQRTAILQQQTADEIQAGNDTDHLRRIQERTNAQLQEVNAAEKLASINAERGIDNRNLAVSVAVSNLQKELLTGLDSEVAGIESTIAARRRAVIEAKNGTKEEADQLGVLDQIHDKLIDIAERNADLSQVDAISNILSNISNSYAAQVDAIDLTRAAERQRFDQALHDANTEIGLRKQLLAAFDDETEAKKRSAAIGFAGRSAADIAHEKLLTDAYDQARQGAEALGLTRQETLQAEVDAVSRATDSTRAWRDGWTGGIEDALRQMDKFNTAVQAGGELANGFRDSIVNALGEIGQKGKNPFKDFLISNLQGIEHAAATTFANAATRGLGGLLGFNVPNHVDPLSASSVTLASAGSQLIVAASELQAAAFTLGSGASGGFVSSFFRAGVSGGLSGVLPGGVDVANLGPSFGSGGIFNGIPMWARGASPKANRVGGVYGSRTLIEVAEIPGAQEAVIPLAGGKVPVELRDGGAGRARQRVADSTPNRVVNVEGHTITVNMGGIQITGGPTGDPEKMLREIESRVRKGIWSALESGSDRRGVEAVRGVAR
jgi:hypothetical protein